MPISPLIMLAWYVSLSLLTFVAYGVDKSAAARGAWRTPESTLHLLSVLGGWPGALLGQRFLRHKTRKQPFRTIFWLTVVANVAVLTWLTFELGSRGLLGG